MAWGGHGEVGMDSEVRYSVGAVQVVIPALRVMR
jgi:hypothetical protein